MMNEVINKHDLSTVTLSSVSVDSPMTPDRTSTVNSTLPNDSIKFFSLLRDPDIVDFNDSKTYYCLNNRIVAAESCLFASKVFIEVELECLCLVDMKFVNFLL